MGTSPHPHLPWCPMGLALPQSQSVSPLPPPRELREKLKPELMGLIRQQRLLRLCEGTVFRKISSRRRQGY